MEPDETIQEQRVSDRYTVGELLGRGAMGAVYRGRHVALGTEVAIKTLTGVGDRERFLREARIAARIRSPHVVSVLDFDVLSDGTPFIVMELVNGQSLAQLMASGGPLTDEDLRRFMTDTAAGMIAAGEQGVVHRDLKPANLMVDVSGALRVTDFGIAHADTLGSLAATGPELTKSHMLVGTPLYMAPEQAESPRSADVRSDVYGFGATFYHAATGSPPFSADSLVELLMEHRVAVPLSPRSRRPSLSANVSEVIERSLAKSPADRFQSFHEVRTALGESRVSPWQERFDPLVEWFYSEYAARRDEILSSSTPGDIGCLALSQGRSLTITLGDLTEMEADALVSSDDERLSMSGGVSAALNRRSGGVLAAEARRFGRVRQGGAIVTGAGALKARFVIHVVTLDYSIASGSPSRDVLLRAMAGCFYHADTLRLDSLAFPLLGTGTGGFPRDVCLDTMVGYIIKTLVRGGTNVSRVRIVLRRT